MVAQYQSRPGSTRPVPAEDEVVFIQFPGEASVEPHAPVPSLAGGGQSATPREIVLGGIPHPSLRLRSPLRLEVSREEGSVGVWSPELEEMGYGPNLGAAIEDFQQTLVELFLSLEADANTARIGPSLDHLWRQLQSVIDRRA